MTRRERESNPRICGGGGVGEEGVEGLPSPGTHDAIHNKDSITIFNLTSLNATHVEVTSGGLYAQPLTQT